MKSKWLLGIQALCLFCLIPVLGYAYSGFHEFLGREAFLQNRPDRAFQRYQKAEKFLFRKDAVYEGLALSASKLAEEKEPFLAVSLQTAELWRQTAPWNAKAYIHSAKGILKNRQEKPSGLGRGDWNEIKPLLYKASGLEPGSAWIKFKAAQMAFRFRDDLDPDEISWAFRQLITSARIRYHNRERKYLEEPSPYLLPALRLLHRLRYPDAVLKAAVPDDYLSRRVWMEFLEQTGRWRLRYREYAEFRKKAEAYYDYECARGEMFLKQKSYQRAYYAFRKAFWSRDWAHARAKAGILMAEQGLRQFRSGPHELMKMETEEIIRQILTEVDYPISRDSLAGMEPVVLAEGNPELHGLWQKRMTGEIFRSEEKAKAYDPSLWGGDAVHLPLKKGAKMNYPMFLGKGRNLGKVGLSLRASQPGGWALLAARVNQREVGEFLADNYDTETTYTFFYDSQGGERWLQLEVIQFEPPDLEIEFGKVKSEVIHESAKLEYQ